MESKSNNSKGFINEENGCPLQSKPGGSKLYSPKESNNEFIAGSSCDSKSSKRHLNEKLTDINNESLDSSDEENDSIKWIEEDSESEECNNEVWDQECIVLSNEFRMNALIGYHKNEESYCNEPIVKKKKLSKELNLNSVLNLKNIKDQFSKSWSGKLRFEHEDIDLISNPFQLCTINNFIDNEKILSSARLEMNNLVWNKRRLDLYEFFQTQDLIDCEYKSILSIYKFLKTDVMSWIRELTGYELSRISASCSLYTCSDYLLVHDDLQSDRCIAFVLYLTDPPAPNEEEIWQERFGGSLQLFSKDIDGHPKVPCREIYPRNNQFVFFKVTNDSYHQVAEVKSMDHCRMSINGWFHCDKITQDIPPRLKTPTDGLFGSEKIVPHNDFSEKMSDWISSIYLEEDTKISIQEHVEENSEISLENYFLPDKFIDVVNAFSCKEVEWKWVGPPNRRHYEVAEQISLPQPLKAVMKLFQSIEMFSLLQDYTELDLIPDSQQNPSVRVELQRWSSSCYLLMSEKHWFSETELDVIMYFGCKNETAGGQTMYVARSDNDQEALITLLPRNNALNLVYRESETARVVQHISERSENQLFYMIVCSYRQ